MMPSQHRPVPRITPQSCSKIINYNEPHHLLRSKHHLHRQAPRRI